MIDPVELASEQDYFDRAADQQRESLRRAEVAGQSAGDRKSATSLKERAGRLHNSVRGDQPVAFGRAQLDDGLLYIGKRSILASNRDVLVVNWQAPAAEPYFQATPASPGRVISRRKYDAPGNTIRGWDDVVLAHIAANVEALEDGIGFVRRDDAVLAALDGHRDDAMRDIVATIHATQDGIVRCPLDRLLVVPGGPGTGKTAVALHRVSWILFNHPQVTAADVLVVGPNPTFIRYISRVLPDLGDLDVAHSDLKGLGPIRSAEGADDPDVAHLKGDPRMSTLLRRAVAMRVRNVRAADAAPFGLSEADVTAATSAGRNAMATAGYLAGRAEVRSQLTASVGEVRRLRPKTDDDARRQKAAAQVDAVQPLVDKIWPSLSPAQVLRELLGSRERLLEAAGEDFSAAEVSSLHRPQAPRLSEEPWSDADVPLLDELDHLIGGSTERYRHIVVDEAQDLSPMQLRSIRRRSVGGSMTVVGDLAQSTGPWARDTWDDVIAALGKTAPLEIRPLSIGYRVPGQVMAIAERLLPQIAPELTAPKVIRDASEDPTFHPAEDDDLALTCVDAAQRFAARGLFVGVVAPSHRHAEIAGVFRRRGVSWSEGRSGALGASGINLVDPQTAKGLEFEAVVVVDPAGIHALDQGARLLYIALTRTTKFLCVVHSGLTGTGLDADAPLNPAPEVGEERSVAASEPVAQGSEGPRHATPQPPATESAPFGAPATNEFAETDQRRGLLSAAEGDRGHRDLPTSSVQRRPVQALEIRVVAASAQEISGQIREAVSPELWAAVLDAVRQELEITGEELLEFLD